MKMTFVLVLDMCADLTHCCSHYSDVDDREKSLALYSIQNSQTILYYVSDLPTAKHPE